MSIMNIPGFTAEASLYRSGGYRRHRQSADADVRVVVPAIPYCGNCDWILDNCERNGWHPRGLCDMCLRGMCYDQPTPGETS